MLLFHIFPQYTTTGYSAHDIHLVIKKYYILSTSFSNGRSSFLFLSVHKSYYTKLLVTMYITQKENKKRFSSERCDFSVTLGMRYGRGFGGLRRPLSFSSQIPGCKAKQKNKHTVSTKRVFLVYMFCCYLGKALRAGIR